ncbi:MAG: DUF4349 domain-containing protein [Cryomorphaceae bacterium]|nr:MAG: DUF4349 domain-containing protein [Cryomorphaceae bacterium]
MNNRKLGFARGRLLALGLLIVIAGCGGSGDSAYTDTVSEPHVPSQKASVETQQPRESRMIRTGRLVFETEDPSATRSFLVEEINLRDGYITSDETSKSLNRLSTTLEVRIPSEQFGGFLERVSDHVTRFDTRHISARDVSEEYVDVEARLKTKKDLETRYLELLSKAVTISEMLEIEHQIGLLRAEIESMEGRLKYLDNRVSYSTLSITYYELTPEEKRFGSRFIVAFKSGWDNLISFLIMMTHIWPFFAIGIAIALGFSYFGKRKRTK